MKPPKPDSEFGQIHKNDGLHAPLIESPALTAIYLTTYMGGEQVNLIDSRDAKVAMAVVAERRHPSDEDLGGLRRLHRLVTEVARFLTTGGTWEELQHTLDRVRPWCFEVSLTNYYLIDTYRFGNRKLVGGSQYVYAHRESDEVVIWQAPMCNAVGGLYAGWIRTTTKEHLKCD